MRNLRNAGWIKIKGGLFLVLGLISGIPQFFEHPTLKSSMLLAMTIGTFRRFYHFAFSPIERYVDPSYHFIGLLSFAR